MTENKSRYWGKATEYFLESCCTCVAEVVEAQRRGCSRIELCENLPVGGVTPSRELILKTLEVAEVPVNVLIRARGGDFVFSHEELRTMISDIEFCRNSGANGVVIGALEKNGDVDIAAMKAMIEASGPLKVTFHRAFDVSRDPISAFENVLALGCDTLLTSGHEENALKGCPLIKRLIAIGDDRITVMPGCGVREGNVEEIAHLTGAKEFHASASFWR